MKVNLDTERLEIRPIVLNDAEFFHKLVNTKGWLEYIGERHLSNKQDAENFIQNILNTERLNYHVFGLKEIERPIGIITFLKRKDEVYPDFGYAMLPDFGGQGLAFEACSAYLEKIRDAGEYEKVLAITKPSNEASIKLLKKLGFMYKGDFTREGSDISYYSINGRFS